MSKKQTNKTKSKVSQDRFKKYGNSGKNKHTGNRTPNERENNRGDIIKEHQKEESKLQNAGHWYYGDVVLGDEISRFSFNQFGGMTSKPFISSKGWNLPTIMSIPFNPCLGVTDAYDSITEANMVYRLQTNGINQALQQWWSVLTSKAGRGAQYSKQDLGILIGAIGELISISEFLRRPFAYKFMYSERTRILPRQLLFAMGFDADDFIAHIADYRLQLNSLITRLNQIPIPGNINYFAKCQNLYQKVYADAGSPLSQLYVPVPYTTWIIDEQLSSTGSVLKTIDGVAEVDRTSVNWHTGIPSTSRTFASWLQQFEQMISALLSSSTWSAIYSDLLNAATFNTVSLWHFDLVTEDYKLEVMYDPSFLLQIHNMMVTPPLVCDGTFITNLIETGSDYFGRYIHGTPLNDVYCDPDLDILVQNPTFGYDSVAMPFVQYPIIVDMLNPNPTPEERIEANVFKYGFSSKTGPDIYVGPSYVPIINMVLPDHYALTPIIWGGNGPFFKTIPYVLYGDYAYESNVQFYSSQDWAFVLSKFQWSPIWFCGVGGGEVANPLGELNYFTLLDQDWVIRTTDAKYLGLFQIL